MQKHTIKNKMHPMIQQSVKPASVARALFPSLTVSLFYVLLKDPILSHFEGFCLTLIQNVLTVH